MNPEMWEFFGTLMAEQRKLVRKASAFLAAYILISTILYVLLDVYAHEKDSLYGLAGLLIWGLGYIMFLGVMQKGGLTTQGTKTGIGTYFALGIAIGIPVTLALIVLIIPGLYLLMRWIPAYSRALISYDGLGKAMRWSWDRTEPWQRPLGLALIFPVLLACTSIASEFLYITFYDYFDWTGFIMASIFWNGAVSLWLAWLTIYGVAAFKLLDGHPASDLDAPEGGI